MICPVKDCGRTISPGRLMCHRHWELLPQGLRSTILRLWNNGKPLDGYREAAENAIEMAQSISEGKTGSLV